MAEVHCGTFLQQRMGVDRFVTVHGERVALLYNIRYGYIHDQLSSTIDIVAGGKKVVV